jgi:phosphoglycerate dehydrogenase-like enzyme
MKFKDFGRSARIELSQMAKHLGMKFIGYNPAAREISLEHKGKGVTLHLDEFLESYQKKQQIV